MNFRPTFDILRNEMNETMREFAIQTIDYVLNSCSNNYGCVAMKLINALNQQYKSRSSQWQTIISSNTNADRMAVDVDYLRGFLLDIIYNNEHRVLIYKTAIEGKVVFICINILFYII